MTDDLAARMRELADEWRWFSEQREASPSVKQLVRRLDEAAIALDALAKENERLRDRLEAAEAKAAMAIRWYEGQLYLGTIHLGSTCYLSEGVTGAAFQGRVLGYFDSETAARAAVEAAARETMGGEW